MGEWEAAGRCGRRRAIEATFSAIRRVFGSDVSALEWKNTVREVGPGAALRSRLVGTAPASPGGAPPSRGGAPQQAGRHGPVGDRAGGLGRGGGEERRPGAVWDSREINRASLWHASAARPPAPDRAWGSPAARKNPRIPAAPCSGNGARPRRAMPGAPGSAPGRAAAAGRSSKAREPAEARPALTGWGAIHTLPRADTPSVHSRDSDAP